MGERANTTSRRNGDTPSDTPGTLVRAGFATMNPQVDRLCMQINRAASAAVAERRDRRGRPKRKYEVAWYVWELLRRSPAHIRRVYSQGWWDWNLPFPRPTESGDAPAEHREICRALQWWIEPRACAPITRFVLRDGRGTYLHTVEDGGPWVALELDLRAQDEVILEAVRALRRDHAVTWQSAKPGKPHWGDDLSPAEAIELFDRHKSGTTRGQLARERAKASGAVGRLSRLHADVVREDERLSRLFSNIQTAIDTDPLAPFRWR